VRAGRYTEALATIAAHDTARLSHDDGGELLILKASAMVGLRDPEAEQTLVEARARAFSSGSPALECEIEYISAFLAWTQGRFDDALNGVDRVLEVSENWPGWVQRPPEGPFFSPSYWRARAYDLRGLTEALCEDYVAQAQSLAKGFEEFDRAQVVDLRVEAAMLANLAVLARDLEEPDLCNYVSDRAQRIAWNDHTALFEYEVYRALAWGRARMGDHLAAFRFFRRSADCAPSLALRVTSVVDRSFLARELGELVTATEDLEYAARLTKSIDWETCSGPERAALFTLAHRIAPCDPKEARRLYDRYLALKSPVSPLEMPASGNRRHRANECAAHAAVLVAEGHRERAISLLRESFQIWSEVGYVWRAATVAVDLAELTGETRFFEVAAREAAKQPHSWLARRVGALAARQPTAVGSSPQG
jgi:tetratricopeptide (TPR) repeat protein